MGDSSSPSSPPTAAAAPPGAEAAAGVAAPVSSATTTGTTTTSTAGRGTAPAVTAAASALTIDPALPPARRPDAAPALTFVGARPSPSSASLRSDQQLDRARSQDDDQDHDRRSQLSSEIQQQTHRLSPASSTTTPPRRRSFFSRFSLPFRAPARTIADFHIRPAEPHRKYVAGDHVLGAVVLAVVKPVRITHLTVSLRGLVRVFKDPNSAATASLPTDTATDSSSSSSRLLSSKSSSSSSSYLGNGHALLFRDEMVLSGTGRLEPGNYEFEFDLIFPSQGLPSSIDFERGSICYVVTATLTRPTTVAPIQSCDRRVYLVDPVDIGTVPKPRPRTISLEPISKRSKKRKIVVVTQTPTAAGSTTVIPAGSAGVPGAMSTISFASGGGSSDRQDATLSERGSARDSAHGTIQTEDNEQEAYAEGRSRTSRASQPRSPAPTDIRSEISVDSVTSGGSESRSRSSGIVGAAGGSGSGSGSGPAAGSGSGGGGGSNIIRLSSPSSSHAPASIAGHSAVSTTGTNTSSSTITNPAAGSNNGNSTGNGYRQHGPAPLQSVSTTTISGVVDDRTITATIDLLKGGCLPGEVVSVKVSVQHVKRIKSLHGVVVTLYRQGRIDSAPPEFMFSSAGTSIAEEDESANGEGGASNGVLVNGSIQGAHQHPDIAGDQPESQSRKQRKQKEKEAKEKAKQLKDRQKDKERSHKGSKDKKSNGSTKLENYYPKSKTGLGGLSLMSAGTCSVFRKDLSQSFSPLIIDPRTLQSSVTASVRMPEDAFATIKGVPGDMISFKYQLEVIVDLGGKLAGLLQSGVGPAGPNLVSNSSNPYDGKPTSALWSGGTNMIDTDQLRRQKGVIFVAFEVVVGTTDTSRQRGRGLKGAALSPDIQQQPDQQQLLLQQQQQQQQQQPLPYVSHHPPDWYPEDRKGSYQQHPQQPPYPSWPANGVASGSGAAGPSTAAPGPPDDPYYHQQHPYYQYPQQQPDYGNHNYSHQSHHGPNYDYYDPGSPSTSAPPRPPYSDRGQSTQAPQYVPTAEMLAAERDPNISEKERIRRAEQRLLPSQPGEPSQPSGASAPLDNGEGSSSSASRHAPTAPTAPSLDELTAYGPSAPPFDADAGPGPSQPPSEDKQELERRRLLAEASAPPDFPEDYQDAGPSSGSSRGGRPTRSYTAGGPSSSGAGAPSFSGGGSALASPSAPSAPVLEEEDGHHHQYNQSPAYRHPPAVSSPLFPSAPAAGPSAPPSSVLAPSAPPADALLGDDNLASPGDANAPSAPPAEDVDASVEGTTDEERYGRHYTYGPGSGPEAAHGSNSAGDHAEPLPRYER